ncbi:Xanthine/uracil/thiamine/ascorbate permease family protein [Minicystis rosea]|nr:Xanthine/uracil/thiamine/ascorbate permease family protein [Minicystis rosea]
MAFVRSFYAAVVRSSSNLVILSMAILVTACGSEGTGTSSGTGGSGSTSSSSGTSSNTGGAATSSSSGGTGGAATSSSSSATTSSSGSASSSSSDASSSSSSGTGGMGGGTDAVTFMVVRVGDGSAELSNASTATFLEERNLDGSLVAKANNPLALPTAVVGNNQPFAISGTATSEGGLSRSANGKYVTLAGYASAPGVASIKGKPSATVNRVVARVDASYAIDTSTRLDSAFNTDNVRGATSNDGSAFWVSGTGAGNTGGVWHLALGATGGVQLVGQTGNLPNNVRQTHVFDGQLFGVAGASPMFSVFTVGTGLPTTMTTGSALPGMPTASGPSPFSFALFDRNAAVPGLDTCYVADDRGTTDGGGVQKWTYDGTQWKLATTFNQGLNGDLRGLAGAVTGASVTLIVSDPENVYALVDDGSASPAATKIATAPANTAFRGVALAPN